MADLLMADLIVRPALFEDADKIASIQIAAWRERLSEWAPDWFIARFKQDEQAVKYGDRIKNPDYAVYVAEADGQIIGFAGTKLNDAPPTEYTHQIGALYVDPSYEGRGAGTALMRAVIDQSREKGIESLVVWTFRDNETARRLYAKHGGVLLDHTESEDMDLDIPHVSYGWALQSN